MEKGGKDRGVTNTKFYSRLTIKGIKCSMIYVCPCVNHFYFCVYSKLKKLGKELKLQLVNQSYSLQKITYKSLKGVQIFLIFHFMKRDNNVLNHRDWE